MPPDCRSELDTSSPSLVHLGVFHGRPEPTPSPAETVRGIRPLPRPIMASSLTKAVPCLLSRDLLFFQAYRKLSYSGFSLLAPLGVTPSWALVLWPPITHLTPNLSFPLTEQTTPLCRLRIKYYAHGCPRSVDSSIVCVIRICYLSLFLRFPIYLRCVAHHTLGF